jgi:hypothetical protein
MNEIPVLSMDRSLQAVLSTANAEQNQHYPIHVFDTHYNLVSSWLMDECVKVYPENRSVVDLLKPFMAKKLVPVQFGVIELPDDYRHFTGGGIFLEDKNDPKKTRFCLPEDIKDGEVPTDDQLKEMAARKHVVCQDLDVVDVDEYNDLTTHSFKMPTLIDPIGCDFEGSSIKVLPPDIPFVELRYIRMPKTYRYGYSMNPDESYSYDPDMKGAVESEWRDNAHAYIYKGLYTLYSIFARDGELRDGGQELKKIGLF